MPVFGLMPPNTIYFQAAQEAAMGVHVALVDGEFCLVFGCAFGVVVDNDALEEIARLSEPRWYAPSFSMQQQMEAFGGWLSSLRFVSVEPVEAELGAELLPYIARGIAPPKQPPIPSTHLPHTLDSTPGDVFYRWEAVPVSRKINQKSGQVMMGTYAAPASEVPFCPTGLAAVARYALPSIMPAQWRWELKPPANTTFKCGASVPLNGQSGGGVEVMFPNIFNNEGPIANPVVLPIL